MNGGQHGEPIERAKARDNHGVAGVVRGLLDAVERRRRPVQGGIEGDDAERVGAPRHERPRRRVRPVVELANRGEHPFARRVAHIRAVVEHARNRLVRDPRELRYVGHHRRTSFVRLGGRRRHAVTSYQP